MRRRGNCAGTRSGAMYLSPAGRVLLDSGCAGRNTAKVYIQEVALFTKGYLKDYPVFCLEYG